MLLRPTCPHGPRNQLLVCDGGRFVEWDRRNVVPTYPRVLLSAGVEEWGEVSFMVKPDGTVDSSSVKFTSPRLAYSTLQLRAMVLTWRFKIKRLPTEPVTAAIRYAIVAGFCADSSLRSVSEWITLSSPPELRVTGCAMPLIPGH